MGQRKQNPLGGEKRDFGNHAQSGISILLIAECLVCFLGGSSWCFVHGHAWYLETSGMLAADEE